MNKLGLLNSQCLSCDQHVFQYELLRGGHHVAWIIGIIIEWFFVRFPLQYLSKATLLVLVVVAKDAYTQHENQHKNNCTGNTSYMYISSACKLCESVVCVNVCVCV